MGSYVYRTIPSAVRVAKIEKPDGSTAYADVALYSYAFKPGYRDEATAKKVLGPSERAWANAEKMGRKVPAYGMFTYMGKLPKPGDMVFATNGYSTCVDDYVKPVGSLVSLL